MYLSKFLESKKVNILNILPFSRSKKINIINKLQCLLRKKSKYNKYFTFFSK